MLVEDGMQHLHSDIQGYKHVQPRMPSDQYARWSIVVLFIKMENEK